MTIKEFRTKYNLTQDDICNILKIKQGSYSMIESGKRKLNIEYAKILGKKFGFDWWLFYEE